MDLVDLGLNVYSLVVLGATSSFATMRIYDTTYPAKNLIYCSVSEISHCNNRSIVWYLRLAIVTTDLLFGI